MEALDSLKGPRWETFKIPVILSEAQPAQIISKSRKEIETQSIKLQKRIDAVLRNPAQHDDVYQTVQRLFRNNSALNLTRDNKIRFTIRRLAWKRFVLGYPPRKPSDTSLGDPINWEWLIHCAKATNKNVIIVSRDSDYGYRYGKEPIINDWLLQEFKDRVSRKKKVILTNRLTHAFEIAKVTIKPREVSDENKLINEMTDINKASASLSQILMQRLASIDKTENNDIIRKWIESKWAVADTEGKSKKTDEE